MSIDPRDLSDAELAEAGVALVTHIEDVFVPDIRTLNRPTMGQKQDNPQGELYVVADGERLYYDPPEFSVPRQTWFDKRYMKGLVVIEVLVILSVVCAVVGIAAGNY